MANEDPMDGVPDEDLGERITLLANHSVPAPTYLMSRVRGSIFRRTLAGDFTRFAAWGPFTALMELLKALFEGFRGPLPAPTTDDSEEA